MATNTHLYLRLIIFWCVVSTISANCNQTYDPSGCEYNMYCENRMEGLSNNWDHYRRDSGFQLHEFECVTSVNVNGYVMDTINLVLKDYGNQMSIIPSGYMVNTYILSLIVSLDLSNNYYSAFPALGDMNNLAKLDLSYNSISTAILSSTHTLPALKEINLSHNNMEDIQKAEENEVSIENLEILNMSYNNFLQVPEAVFDSFSNLKDLDFSHNFIKSLNQLTFEGVKKLINLNMSHNRLVEINASLFRFSELKTLDLSNNQLRSIKTNDFNALTQLTTLNLKSNLIASIDKESFLNLHVLNSLDISDNELDIMDKDIFKNNDVIKNIQLSNNKFKTLTKSLFKGKSIEFFSIVENNLEGSVERGTFEGLLFVTELDLSSQHLDSIGDNAFYGLGGLVILLLQNNNIETLSSKCFNSLINLKQLDLSNNKIKTIEFEKERLESLESLSIRNNYLTVVKHEHFQGLDSLQVLDLSDNKISRLESDSFKSLKNLISFEISNNPLNGSLEENAFEGLNSLPSLDISCSLLTTIQNGSFNGMIVLKTLNISHSTIETIQFNSFICTGAMEILDLSYNNIKEFNLNNTHISNLDTLYLNNNHIKVLDSKTFAQIMLLTKIDLSHNEIEHVDSSAFSEQIDLRVLDMSYNPKFMFDVHLINNTKLTALHLSGSKTGMSFDEIKNVPLTHITISNASILDIKSLKLNGLKHLNILDLSYNKITKVDIECFTNLSTLTTLDLSFNEITYIQPGAFKDNTEIHTLNVSHNHLASLSYGVFRGLVYLNTLDISFNNIDNLQNERLFELQRLNVLIADHNRIETIKADEFVASLSKLSIGDNPLPCDFLVNLQQSELQFEITAIQLDYSKENVHGVTCNKNKYFINRNPSKTPFTENNKNLSSILINIRDILLNKFTSDHETVKSKDEEYLANISSQISKTSYNNQIQLSNLTKLTSLIADKNDTNILLEKILKVLTINSIKRPTTPVPITKDNATYENIVSYINKLKQQLEATIAYEKTNILNEVDVKLSAVSKDPVTVIPEPFHEKLSSSSPESKPIFTETCVALILLILVCLVLYQFYKSGLFIRKRRSISTRELPGAMDSTL